MYGSPFKDRLYTEDETFVTGIDSFAELVTPLKKLPNTSVNDARQTVLQTQANATTHPTTSINTSINATTKPYSSTNINIDSTSEDTRASKYRFFEELALVPLGESELSPDRSFDASDYLFTKTAERPAQITPDYTTKFNDGPLIPERFIPPRIEPKNRNPIVVTAQYESRLERNIQHWTDSEADAQSDVPSGEWTSPVIREALRRQVNKEQQFRTLWKSVAVLFVFHLTLSMGEHLHLLFRITYQDENQMYRSTAWTRFYALKGVQTVLQYLRASYAHVKGLHWIMVAIIIVNAVRLFLPQDQCKDLPLTNQQRELIGLQLMEDSGDVDGTDSDLIIKQRLFKATTPEPLLIPKYLQENELGAYKRTVADDTEVAIALRDLLPAHKLRRS